MNETEQLNELDKIGVRFDQFIIAVNGALIAYSMKQIEDEILTVSQIPLGMAIIFWGLSFYYGINSIRRLITTRIIGVLKERNEIKLNPEFFQMARDKFNEVGSLANKNNKRMYNYLYAGGISFIIWQIIEMSILTF